MELRSKRQRNEYKELQLTLKGMGFYEEGMDLQEMREIINVLEMSANDEENNLLEFDIQQAIKESELDFMPNQDSSVLNSTMMSLHLNVSPCSSPEISSQRITFEADVHHAIDWTPSDEDCSHESMSDNTKPKLLIPQIKINDDSQAPDIESYCEDNNSINLSVNEDNAWGNGNSSVTSISSMATTDNNNSQFSNISSHVVLGPVSWRINDSGLNTTRDIRNSSTNDNDDNGNDNRNNSEVSIDVWSNFEHEIFDLVTMRRINDSRG